MNNKKYYIQILVIILMSAALLIPSLVKAELKPLIIQVTSDANDHKWPSINNVGHIVWSQKIAGNYQVFKCIPASNKCDLNNTTQISSGSRNHEQPVISDDGTIIWVQDNSGSINGLEVIRREPGGSESVIETSTRNNFNGQHRDAGKNFGISSDGRSISYYTFFGTTKTRRFNVSGIGELKDSLGNRGDFPNFDFPDINKELDLVFASGFNSIVKAKLSEVNPGDWRVTQQQVVGSGTKPRISDRYNSGNTEIVYLNGGKIYSKFGNDPSQLIDTGSEPVDWLDVNNAGSIAFEQATLNGTGLHDQQIFLYVPIACSEIDDIDGNGNPDNDEDGLCDSWETSGIDINEDGIIDLPLQNMGANPNHKNIYVEVDYMDCNKPGSNCGVNLHPSHKPMQSALGSSLRDVRQAFLNAPVHNPDGIDGINLNFFDAPEAIPEIVTLSFGSIPGAMNDFQDIKNTANTGARCDGYFGTPSERNSPNCENILAAKRLAFRYLIFGHEYDFAGNRSSGRAEIWGDDFLVTLGNWSAADMNSLRGAAADGRREAESGTIMHELGHTLGLRHGGVDDINCKPNYLSVMNYALTWRWIDRNRPLDYSRWTLQTLNEFILNENDGMSGPVGRATIFGPFHQVGLTPRVNFAPAFGPIDWDRDGSISSISLLVDINDFSLFPSLSTNCPVSKYQILHSFNDWENLKFGFLNSPYFQNGSATISSNIEEITADQVIEIGESLDSDEDGIVNAYDNCPALPNSDQTDSNHDGIGDVCTPVIGDIDEDRDVDCADIGIIKAAFGKRFGQAGFDFRADLNFDDLVDIRDLSIVSRQLPAGSKCK